VANFRTYAVGEKSAVIRRDDHAGSFIDVSPPIITSRWTILDVMSNPDNVDHVIAVGQCIDVTGASINGVIISYDAGVNWSCPLFTSGLLDAVNTTFHEVWFVDANVVWITGTNGYILKSLDGGLSFTKYDMFTPVDPAAVTFTTAIHAISDQVAVVAGTPTFNTTGNGLYIWKTIDGGFTWNQLNTGIGSTPIGWTLPGGPGGGTPVTGPADGVWIRDDEQVIIIGAKYGQAVSYNGGTSFQTADPGNLEMTRSGFHLTWYPSYGDPTNHRHVGGAPKNVFKSIDNGVNWTNDRSDAVTVIRGAHFYTELDGYYVTGGAVLQTNDGAISGVGISIPPVPAGVSLIFNAVWTGYSPTIYQIVDCSGIYDPVYSTDPLLSAFVGQTIEYNNGIDESPICSFVEIYTGPTPIEVLDLLPEPIGNAYVNCAACLDDGIDDGIDPDPDPFNPPTAPGDVCYDLISCNGECDDLEGISGISFPATLMPGDLYYINGDITCIYGVYPMRQTFYYNLETNNLYNDIVIGGGDYTIGVTSLLYNGVEQVTTPFSYLINPVTYQVVQVTGYIATIVPAGTTENCVDNTQSFLNSVFDSLSLPLEAYSDDPAHCACDLSRPGAGQKCGQMFRIQYRDGNIFVITFTITSSTGVNKVFELRVDPGNISVLSDVTTPGAETAVQMCNKNVYCPPVKQPTITSIDPWLGDCPVPIVYPPVIVEEPCDIIPRLGEPGFSTLNCDPKTVIKNKTLFSNSVWALVKRMRYGITTCCEYDLDKIDIKNELLELGEIYDPTLCVNTTPVIDPCAPEPVEPIPAPDLGVVCPEPVGPITSTLTITPPIVACDAPDGATTLLTIP